MTENALSPIANILVNNPAADATGQDTQSETALVHGGGNNIIASFNDSGSLIGGASKFTGFSLSINNGSGFTDKGTLPTNPDGDSGDPVLARSAKTGTILLSTLASSRHKLMIFRSTNNGASFLAPVNGAPGFTTADGNQDKEWIATDNFAGPGFGNVYMFWRNFAAGGGMTFTRSVNDGVTWTPNKGLKITNGVGQGAFVTVGSDHAVYLFWFDQSGTPFRLNMVKSTNQGVSFGPPVVVTTLKATGVNGDLGLSPNFRTNCFPQAAANPNPALAQHLYIVYPDRNGADHADIFFRRSTNGGTTWSAPLKVNDDVTKHDQWQPALAITPNGQRLSIGWYDRRLDPANNLIDRFGVIGKITAAGVGFTPNFRITNQSFPPAFGVDPVVNATYMSDYDQMAADASFFYQTWGDNRDNSSGHAGKNANVRFARIPVNGPTMSLASDSGDEGEDGEGHEIAISALPAFVTEALDAAVSAAPDSVMDGKVKWLKAFEFGDTVRIFQVQGKDKDGKGKDIEAEVKGNRVIELEARVPSDQIPDRVATALKEQQPSFRPEEAEVIIVAGKVVSYGFEPKGEEERVSLAPGKKTEIYLSPEGKVISKPKAED